MTIYQLRHGPAADDGPEPDDLSRLPSAYDAIVKETRHLLLQKNQDYGEAWKEMLITSLTDMIIVKLMRLRQLLAAPEKQADSEAVSNLQDIFNYAVFALVKLKA